MVYCIILHMIQKLNPASPCEPCSLNGVPGESDREPETVLEGSRADRNPGQDLIYSIHNTPPWYICLLLGFQVRFIASYAYNIVRLNQVKVYVRTTIEHKCLTY